MTRENKLALVVGFALILLVGILVSDHFSAASRQESADLLPASDPLVETARTDPELLVFQPAPRRPFHDPFPERTPLPVDTSVTPAVRMPDLQREPTPPPASAVPADGETSAAESFVYHHVRNGESLSAICQSYYGHSKLVGELARYNDLDDPDLLRVGLRLRVPKASALARGAGAARAPTAAPARTTYTVRDGDILSRIASRLLGSAGRWRDVYEENRDVIEDPDHLEVGTVLRIPR